MRSVVREALLVFLLAAVAVSLALATVAPFGSDTSWLMRAADLLKTAFTFDYGNSDTLRGAAIRPLALKRAMVNAGLIALTVLVVVSVGVPLGVRTATHAGSTWLRSLRVSVNVASSMPVLFWCTALYIGLARGVDLPPNAKVHPWIAVAAAVLALSLGDRLLADLVKRVEIATREILNEPYLRTIRAGGFGVQRHVLQGLVAPVAAALYSRAMFLVGGAIVVEYIFSFNGLGTLVVQALTKAPDVKVALAGSVVLAGFGAVFRLMFRAAVLLADRRAPR